MAQVDNTKDLTSFKALSFDCYGTLIDWETGIRQVLSQITSQLPPDHPYAKDPEKAMLRFDEFSNALEREQPTLRYDLNLSTSVKRLAAELGVPDTAAEPAVQAMTTGPGKWAAFDDTVQGLRVLRRHYKLIILSNIDDANIRATVSGPLGGVPFDAVYTAQQIGSYKPDPRNFRYLFSRAREDLGVDAERGELLHVARSLVIDHTAAKALGFESVWIARGGDRKDGEGVGGDCDRMVAEGKVSFQWKFDTIGEFAEEVARQFDAK